jgi:tetratricopeptide (TPR) repeat protein
MVRRIRAVLLAKSASRHFGAGRVEEGLQAVRKAGAEFARLTPDRWQRSDLGRAYHLEAQLECLAGRPDRALTAFGEAERLLSIDPQNREDYGRCLHDAAQGMREVVPDDIIAGYIQRARIELRGAGDHYQGSLDEMESSLGDGADPAYQAKLAAMISTASDQDERHRLNYQLARRLITSEAHADRVHAVSLFAELAHTYKEQNQLDPLIAVLGVLPHLADLGMEIPGDLSDAAEFVVERAGCLSRPADQGAAYQARAVVLAGQGRLREALDHALRAVAIHDYAVWSVESSLLRTLSADEGNTARHVALMLAFQAEEPALAAELVETARLQVLPAAPGEPGITSNNTIPNNAIPSVLASIGQQPLTPIRPVTVTGTSRL